MEAYERADPSKFVTEIIVGDGVSRAVSMGDEEEVQGTIASGIARFDADPVKYVAISYQSDMVDWPEDQQCYTLLHRRGTTKYTKIAAEDGWQTTHMHTYEVLPKRRDLGAVADAHTDGMNYGGYLLHDEETNPPLMPGRGMGCADIPGLKIIGDVDPNDVQQGGVGDCWLLSAISALAEFDGAVHKLFENTPGGIEDMPRAEPNEYHVTLYDLKTWEPVDVVIDERLAARPDGSGQLLGARPSEDGELWVCYLEKAFAVHCGGWDEIDGGEPPHAWSIMTGCKEVYSIFSRLAEDGETKEFRCYGQFDSSVGEWAPQANSTNETSQTVFGMPWPEVGREHGDESGPVGADDLFRKIAAWDANNYIIAAGTSGDDDNEDTDGIVDGHAYTVIRAVENVAGSGCDLLQVRNPHGRGEMENGRWDDDGPGWDEHPEVRDELQPEQRDDGIFWMSKEEFVTYFDTVYLCAKDMTEFLTD